MFGFIDIFDMNLKKHYNIVVEYSHRPNGKRIRFICSINRLGDYIGEKRADIIRKNLKKHKDFKPKKYTVQWLGFVDVYCK